MRKTNRSYNSAHRQRFENIPNRFRVSPWVATGASCLQLLGGTTRCTLLLHNLVYTNADLKNSPGTDLDQELTQLTNASGSFTSYPSRRQRLKAGHVIAACIMPRRALRLSSMRHR